MHIHTPTLLRFCFHTQATTAYWPPSALWPLDEKRWWCWERLRAGGEGDDGWVASLTQQTWVCADSQDSEGQGSLARWGPWGSRVGHAWATDRSGAEQRFLGSAPVLRLATQPRPTVCDPADYSPPGSSVSRDSPGQNTAVGCHALLQRLFPTRGWNPGLPHCRRILSHPSHQGSPCYTVGPCLFFIHFPLKSFS